MLPFVSGKAIPLAELLEEIQRSARDEGVEGVTLLGGEPFAHARGAAKLAQGAQQLGLSVMVFTGFTLGEIRTSDDPDLHELLASADVLVDGPYRRELPELRRRWVGSSNQQIHFLTRRYHVDQPCWRLPNTLEIRLRGAELLLNGFPAPSAVGLWTRPRDWAPGSLP
jgi:anaerobic ribonucleoside-triphosphate reductase activating protein